MKTINTIHLICLVLLAIGFVSGIIPGVGTFAMFGVLPLAIISLILSIVEKNGLLTFSILNLILAIITLIPLIGTITAIIGLVISIIAIVKLVKVSKA